jgi:hypothetical protein
MMMMMMVVNCHTNNVCVCVCNKTCFNFNNNDVSRSAFMKLFTRYKSKKKQKFTKKQSTSTVKRLAYKTISLKKFATFPTLASAFCSGFASGLVATILYIQQKSVKININHCNFGVRHKPSILFLFQFHCFGGFDCKNNILE